MVYVAVGKNVVLAKDVPATVPILTVKLGFVAASPKVVMLYDIEAILPALYPAAFNSAAV